MKVQQESGYLHSLKIPLQVFMDNKGKNNIFIVEKSGITSNKIYQHPVSLIWCTDRGAALLPKKIHNLNVIMRRHQENPSWLSPVK